MAAFALCFAALVVQAADDGHSRVPVLLELFTSEGCSSCPPADRLLEILDEKQPVSGALVIALSEHVDYWDRLGWKDPFSSAQYTERQQEYTSRYRFDGVYTPQLVVDGRYGFVGSDSREASTAIQKAIRDPKVPMTISNLARNRNEVTARIALPADRNFRGARAMLYVALADNRQESHVERGENGGRTLAHVAVARILRQVGMIDLDAASAKEIALPVQGGSGSGLRLVAFIQDARTGRVVAVAEQKL
jgi:hypothetical protein